MSQGSRDEVSLTRRPSGLRQRQQSPHQENCPADLTLGMASSDKEVKASPRSLRARVRQRPPRGTLGHVWRQAWLSYGWGCVSRHWVREAETLADALWCPVWPGEKGRPTPPMVLRLCARRIAGMMLRNSVHLSDPRHAPETGHGDSIHGAPRACRPWPLRAGLTTHTPSPPAAVQ